MTFSRGDVVIVRWPNKYNQDFKGRPAIIIQADAFLADDNVTVLIPFTSDIQLPRLNCRIPVLVGTPEQTAMGTRGNSLILPEKVLHLPQSDIDRVIGRCPASVMSRVESSLRYVLNL